ncbi:MAG TPA: aminoacyl-tRNA hydrolase [Firmicutes bacterium]|jgi:PTH1 family peptidyl-tRNA hydrolase|nr:aminoacyl-tRNA hydrolase [Bacillota bacterium]
MKCVVGLGNPGKKYALTKHNAGFMVLDRISEKLGLKFSERGFSNIARGIVSGKEQGTTGASETPTEVLLVKPGTYMNRAGSAIAELLMDFPILPADMLVVHDDMDIPFGKIRFKHNGSSGGHKGIQSIIDFLGGKDFARLKIGIGRPGPFVDPSVYVLAPFEGQDLLSSIIEMAACAVLDSLVSGLDQAMNRYNHNLGFEENDDK